MRFLGNCASISFLVAVLPFFISPAAADVIDLRVLASQPNAPTDLRFLKANPATFNVRGPKGYQASTIKDLVVTLVRSTATNSTTMLINYEYYNQTENAQNGRGSGHGYFDVTLLDKNGAVLVGGAVTNLEFDRTGCTYRGRWGTGSASATLPGSIFNDATSGKLSPHTASNDRGC